MEINIHQATNRSSNPASVILNYGIDRSKSGGFIFTIPQETTEKNYLVRISSQYNWWIKKKQLDYIVSHRCRHYHFESKSMKGNPE